MELAPIVLFCYNRPLHLRNTVEALRKNTLAPFSHLLVFSDGPKSTQDLVFVEEVRTYLTTVEGFKSVEICISELNKGLARSVIDGVSRVLAIWGKAIVMEDDLKCSEDFLQFMNDALEKYENYQKVFSVSGFNFGIEKVTNEDVALVSRASSYGWGTWTDRWEKVDWEMKEYGEFLKSKEKKELLKNAGEDILPMLIKQQSGLINSWAVRWTYFHAQNEGYCLVPNKNKIITLGIDGSGTHSVARTLRKNQEVFEGEVTLPNFPKPEPRVTQFIRYNNRPSLIRRLINLWKFGIW